MTLIIADSSVESSCFSKVESRRAALGAMRAYCETQDSYYEDVSEDEAISKLLAEEEQMSVEQHPSINEDANDGVTSEAETFAIQDDSTPVMRDSPFQDGDTFDGHSYNDDSVHSDTFRVLFMMIMNLLRLYTVSLLMKDNCSDVIPNVISEDELAVTQPDM